MPTEIPENERAIRPAGSLELDPTAEGIATEETRRLISSSKVEGTAVFDRAGQQIGTISSFMVDKVSGQVAYALMSFGGFLGLGESHHPLPWRALTYDVRLRGYVVDVDRDALTGAPRLQPDGDPSDEHAYGKAVDAYYRTVPTS